MNRDEIARIIHPEVFEPGRRVGFNAVVTTHYKKVALAKADAIIALPTGGGVEDAASEWLGELADRLEMLAPDVSGSTHLNGEIRSFRHIVTVSARQLRRFAALSPRSADGQASSSKPREES